MKKEKISETIGQINQKYVTEAITYIEEEEVIHHSFCIKWSAIAVSFVTLIIVGTTILKFFQHNDISLSSKYKYQFSTSEICIEWPWAYKTNSEKYPIIKFNGKQYKVKSLEPIDTKYLEDILGTCNAEGIDRITNKKHSESFKVYKIKSISPEKIIAIGNDIDFYVYEIDNEIKPATFGEIMDLYNLPETLDFNRFSENEGYQENGYFILKDDTYIWKILFECRDAKLCDLCDNCFEGNTGNYLSFTATSNPLGVYKKVVTISEDGYLSTNIFNYNSTYFIGEDAARKIIDYADDNSTETIFEPYAPTIAGTLIDIGKDYVLIDDTIMCKNKKDGTVYKIYTNDIRMTRCIEYLNIKIGDTVCVNYKDVISDDNEINSAYSLYEVYLENGDLSIPE